MLVLRDKGRLLGWVATCKPKGSRRLVADLGEEALPVFLVAAIGFFQVFEDALEVAVAF